MTETIEKSVEIERPVTTVYNQWTLFEEFPRFMDGVERVEQVDDRRLRWTVDIAGVDREFEAEITEQTPDQVIEWRALGETTHDGRVTFESLGASRTRVDLRFQHDPSGLMEKAGHLVGAVERRVEGDLERFKEFIEERGVEEGGWRGEV